MGHFPHAAFAAFGLSLLAVPVASCSAAPASADRGKPAGPALAITDLATFDEPWAMAFEPGTDTLFVTERGGTLRFRRSDGTLGTVSGVPRVLYRGQGGLGDIAFAPDYATSRLVYFSWAEPSTGETHGAAVGRAKLVCDGGRSCALENLELIWRQSPKTTGDGHYSHRITFSPDGQYLFIASGERQKFDPAQDMTGNLGKIVRLLPNGAGAPGNPFSRQVGLAAQTWTLGHRNILGLRFDPAGRLWDLEHGPRGGDELNLVKPGANYGWPVVSQGDHYDGRKIPRHATRPDFAAPAISWNPVIAPGDFVFYTGAAFPAWNGQAIIAGLVCECLVRVGIDGERASELDRIPLGKRIRDVAQAPDGTLWVLEDGARARLRQIRPR